MMVTHGILILSVSYGAICGPALCDSMRLPVERLGNLKKTAPILIVVLLFLLAACQSTEPTPGPLSGTLPIAAPDVATAGDTLRVVIGPVEAQHGAPVGLVTVGSLGPHVYRTTFDRDGMAYFQVPGDDTLQPGYMALIAASGHARGEASIVLFTSTVESAFAATPEP